MLLHFLAHHSATRLFFLGDGISIPISLIMLRDAFDFQGRDSQGGMSLKSLEIGVSGVFFIRRCAESSS